MVFVRNRKQPLTSGSSGSNINNSGGEFHRIGIDWNGRSDSGSATFGFNFQLSSELPHSFSHALNADTRTNRFRHALASIANLDLHIVRFTDDGDARPVTAGM